MTNTWGSKPMILEISSSRKPFMIDMVRISAHTPSVMPITDTTEMKARPPCSRFAPI